MEEEKNIEDYKEKAITKTLVIEGVGTIRERGTLDVKKFMELLLETKYMREN